MFESFYDSLSGKDIVREIEYAQWETPFKLESSVKEIQDSKGDLVPLSDVLCYFQDWFKVEIIKWQYFPKYLDSVENTFINLEEEDLKLFGLPWTLGNFPSLVEDLPIFKAKKSRNTRSSKVKTGKKTPSKGAI